MEQECLDVGEEEVQQYILQHDQLGHVFMFDGSYYVPSGDTIVLQDGDNSDDIIKDGKDKQEEIVADGSDEFTYLLLDDGELNMIIEDENRQIIDINDVMGKNIITGKTVTLDNCLGKKQAARQKRCYNDVINKKIELGVTTKGKRLVGKILHITKSSPQTEGLEFGVSSDYADVISRTLVGLMKMESLQEQLFAKSLLVKVIDEVDGHENGGKMRGCMQESSDGWSFINFSDVDGDEVSDEIAEIKYKLRYANMVSLSVSICREDDVLRASRVYLHPGLKQHVCILCYKEMKTMKALYRHYTNNHNVAEESSCEESEVFVCATCSRIFKSPSSLKRHMATHDPDLRPLECNICKRRFNETTSLKRHLLVHAGIKPHVCDLCNKGFTNVGDLNSHRRTHLSTLHNYTCLICGRKFSRQSNMMRHARIHNNGHHECNICGCTYQHLSSLTRHMLQAHVSVNETTEETSCKYVNKVMGKCKATE